MSIKTTFFNNVSYDAESVNAQFAHMIGNGVISSDIGIGTALKVTLQAGLTLAIANGVYIIQGASLEVYGTGETKTLSAASSQARYDTITVEYNLNAAVNNARLVVVTGTPSNSPVYPTLTQTDLLWQEPIAHVLVPANATTAGTITDARTASKVKALTYNYGDTLPASGAEGDIFFLIAE